MQTTERLFDLTRSVAGKYLQKIENPWEALPKIGAWIKELQKTLGGDHEQREEGIFVHKSAKISEKAVLCAPCIVGAESEIRPGAFLRGNVIVGKNCTVGNSTELKNAVLFDEAQAPHFNYVGDSILGYEAHLGAGVILSNLRSDKSAVFRTPFLYKAGAMVGDRAEIGCNSVLNPGTVIGRDSTVYPLSLVRGEIPEKSICKAGMLIVKKRG